MNNPRKPIDRFHAIIPAGGVGSRLWPLSRASAPKFLHDLTGSGQTLLQDTWDRVTPITSEHRTMIVTGSAHEEAVKAQLPKLSSANLVIEDSPKDSTAAIALAAAILARREPDVIIGSFAADHVIQDGPAFRAAVAEGIELAATGRIVVIGIQPTEPSVGFGYIKTGEAISVPGAPSALTVDKFVEKPKLDRAKKYVESGKYLWNAGMFIAPASLLLEQLSKSEPELHAGILELAASVPRRLSQPPERERRPRLPPAAPSAAAHRPAWPGPGPVRCPPRAGAGSTPAGGTRTATGTTAPGPQA